MIPKRLSVIIPAFNSEATIGLTLDSVLRQTILPDEILVTNDGSTDSTSSLLNAYKPHVTVFDQENRGLAASRNLLCDRAQGDLVAFLDHDDIWHPRYLETQLRHFQEYPNAAAFFTAGVNFYGQGEYTWENGTDTARSRTELIPSLNFLKRYNQRTGDFGSCSFCCVPKRIIAQIGKDPFRVDGADDFYFFCVISTLGPVVYDSNPFVAYRILDSSLSSDRVKSFTARVQTFEALKEYFQVLPDQQFFTVLKIAFASHRRRLAKHLMGMGKTSEARRMFWQALLTTRNPLSMTKSVALLASTYMPTGFQPRWPSRHR